MLKAGASRRRVTPPTWVPYLTSSGNGTHAPFEGVHDELYARALVLDDGEDAIAVLAVDAIGYDNAVLGPGRHFTQAIRRCVAGRTGLCENALMLAATHSHSTPETIGLTPFREVAGVPEWLDAHVEALADAVVEAWTNRQPARAFFSSAPVQGVARYRRIVMKNGTLNRHGDLPPVSEVAAPWTLDETLSVLCLAHQDGSPCAVLANYTAHPVVAMLLPPVSADYPGAATARVEAALPGAVCLFTNGAAGNVNSVHVSTCFDDVEALGQILGTAVLNQVAQRGDRSMLAKPRVRRSSETMVLPPRDCPSVSEVEARVADDPSPQHLRTLRLARKLADGPIEAEVQAMGLGPVRWVSIPGEGFVETGLALKRAGASFVVGYANGWVGYLPIRRAYGEGGYEVDAGVWSRVAPGSAECLEAAGRVLLRRLAR